MRITAFEKCCGCACCADTCPQKCISMHYDEHGFYCPEVDNTFCINCNKCVSVCPQNKTFERNEVQEVYKGFAKEIGSDSNQKSTSGAIFPILAEEIISNGGVAVGAAFDQNFDKVFHIVCEDMSQVERCRGSKYIQSETQGIFSEVRSFLVKGIPVLFTGTPCQVAALKSFLKKEWDILYTVDFVCHGVGSTKFFKQCVDYLSGGVKASHIGFRDKCGNYRNSQFRIIDIKGRLISSIDFGKAHFVKAFANNLISRKSCGTCLYATTKRISDLTLADNILFNTDLEKALGSSLIFVNTKKGKDLFNLGKDKMSFEELHKEKVLPMVMHLNHPALAHRDRNKILDAMSRQGYAKAAKYISDYIPKETLIKRTTHLLKRVVRRISRGHCFK